MSRVAQSFDCLAAAAALGLAPTAAYAEPAAAPSGQLGDLTGISADGPTVTLESGAAAVRVSFPAEGAVRVWLAPDGTFTDPAGGKIVLPKTTAPVPPKRVDKGAYWAVSTPKATLRAYKHPLKFALYDGADRKQLWAEAAPLSWTGTTTTQSLTRSATEQFVGGGEQNGRFSHRDQTIRIDGGGSSFRADGLADAGLEPGTAFTADTVPYRVFANSVPLTAGKEVVTVTLPSNSALHVFAVSVA
ncbi:DUF4968 domain-containing protein [Amycolatopsis sp. NBC_01488]|uniref:DUF4968 domain-containing protein n=1 Tax=Amycolatopsis sp. NBC_01488 TaxID=2903563 RepID=UPI002E2842DE|nr:DUF4968 domain-containing protein [Amycolatopsis sp. NBC_01488]